MSISRQHSFWGSSSPLGGLTGAGLLVMASARLSWAITVAGCLFWVYGLTTFSFSLLSSVLGKKIFPAKGNRVLNICLAYFWGSLYLLLFWLLCPFAAYEVFLLLLLIPIYFANSGIIEQFTSLPENAIHDIFDDVSDAVSQAAVLSVLTILFSIIREPLSYCSLSFPGSYQGMITIMYFNSNSFFPIGIFSVSAGALILLGYLICLYQYSKSYIFHGEIK
jgi:hypothetical protein